MKGGGEIEQRFVVRKKGHIEHLVHFQAGIPNRSFQPPKMVKSQASSSRRSFDVKQEAMSAKAFSLQRKPRFSFSNAHRSKFPLGRSRRPVLIPKVLCEKIACPSPHVSLASVDEPRRRSAAMVGGGIKFCERRNGLPNRAQRGEVLWRLRRKHSRFSEKSERPTFQILAIEKDGSCLPIISGGFGSGFRV